MSVFISDKNTAKLYVQFLRQNNPKSKYWCKNELIYIREIWSRWKISQFGVLSSLKTRGVASSF